MKLNTKVIGLVLGALVLLPGCYHIPQYKSHSFQFLHDECTYQETKHNIIVKAKILDKYDTEELFKTYSNKLFNKLSQPQIQVIYFSIHNLSANSYILPSSNGIDLNLISYEQINAKLRTNTSLKKRC
jgi:hypothetical protein